MKKTQVTQVPEKAKKGLFRIIFSRTGIILLLILMQIGLVVGTTYYLEAYKDFIYGIFVLMRVVVLIYIINDSGMPEFKMTWLLFVILTPLIGTIFFIYVKMQPGTKFLRSRQAALKIIARLKCYPTFRYVYNVNISFILNTICGIYP